MLRGPHPPRHFLDAGSPLEIYDHDSSLDAETVLRANYLVVFALIRGSPRRPRLPLEFSAVPKILLKTPPLATPGGGSLRVAHFQVLVKSVAGVDYLTDHYWPKFFIRIFPPVQSEVTFDDSSNLAWPFTQPGKLLRGTSRSGDAIRGPPSRVRRATIDGSHELWNTIKPRDSVELGMNPFRHRAYSDMCDVVIRVYEVWEPSSAMLGLVEANSKQGRTTFQKIYSSCISSVSGILNIGCLDRR
ncbi:hypothetical protein BDV93DRAFT_514002 [Ceratobasidium sp. AG-I]|nr:hypothetical protein BDV93DRAFT_514002 [Ceratobasidium sp. AG-I]